MSPVCGVCGACTEEQPTDDDTGRGPAWRDMMDEAMPPAAAKKPSGGPDCPKLWEALRRRPLSDEEAAGRLIVAPGVPS